MDGVVASDTAKSETAEGLRELLSSRSPRQSHEAQVVIRGPSAEIPPVTVILPAYNEAERLPTAVPRLLADSLLSPGRLSELIIVDDGSSDETAELARELLSGYDNARVLQLPWHAGKGAAVRYGVAAARGEVILFMDADLATELSVTLRLLQELADSDVVIGSRVAAGAVVKGRSKLRHGMHHAFKRHAQRLTGIEVSDPQCGFKAFRADAAKILFHLARTDGFGFDVEILLVARKLGFTIREIPVEWTDVAGSKVRVVRDPIGMAADIAMARVRHARRSPPLLSPSPSR